MPVQLRKRKAPDAAPSGAPPAKKPNAVKAAVSKVKSKLSNGNATASKAVPSGVKPSKINVGDVISLEGFGGTIQTQDGEETTLKALVDKSKGGVVLFTYPKASTPGCTTQACLFRDDYGPLTATGFSIYGLSTDSPKANTTFKAKQNLPYYLLCDPSASLIGAIGLKKAPKGTTRGVFVVNKSGKVLAGEAGGPAATVAVVKNLVEAAPKFEDTKTAPPAPTPSKVDVEKAEVAADVANTAAMLDGESQKV